MRFRIETDIFKKAIEVVSHATGTGNASPILENILIEAGYKRITLTGNNLEMAIEYLIEDKIDVEAEGKFTISSKFLLSYTALVQDQEIIVELEKGGSLKFSTASSETKFKGQSAEKFPVIPTIASRDPLEINAKDMKTAIEKTLFSTADGAVRPVLAGIFLKPTPEGLAFASTDSFRLSECVMLGIGNGQSDTPSVIIPKKTALEIARVVTDEDNEPTIKLYFQDNQLLAIRGKIRISSRLLSGKFPDYNAFFPSEYKTKSIVLRSDFINSLKQSNLVAKENNYNTRLRSLHEGKVEISTGDTEVGASHISLAGSIEGQEDVVGINAQYLLEALAVIRQDYVSFEYKSALSPVILRGVATGNESYQFRHLLMPLKI